MTKLSLPARASAAMMLAIMHPPIGLMIAPAKPFLAGHGHERLDQVFTPMLHKQYGKDR